MAGRRNKREHRSHDRPSDGYGSSGGGAGSSTAPRPTTGRTKMTGRTDTKHAARDAFDIMSRQKRPIARRAISMETGSHSPAPIQPKEEVGALPPQIQDLVPPPKSPVAIAKGLGSDHTTSFTTHVANDPQPHIPDRVDLPDFARGHDGDGTRGAGIPGRSASPRAQSEDRQRKQKDTLAKLRVILAWYVVHS